MDAAIIPIEPDELADLMGDALAYMVSTATIQRDTGSQVKGTATQTISDNRGGRSTISDDRGGAIGSYQVQGTYPCRISPYTREPKDVVEGDSVDVIGLFLLTLPSYADVRSRDKIQVSDVDYTVIESDAGRSNAIVVTVWCRKLN